MSAVLSFTQAEVTLFGGSELSQRPVRRASALSRDEAERRLFRSAFLASGVCEGELGEPVLHPSGYEEMVVREALGLMSSAVRPTHANPLARTRSRRGMRQVRFAAKQRMGR